MGRGSPHVLIVGDGLAGCLVAWELHLRGCSFAVWSDGSPAASDVAAGMSNPVSFKRILPQWNAREQQDEARARYQLIGSQVDATLWRDVPIVRIFPNEEYAERWNERAAGGHGVSPFIEMLDVAELHESIQAPHGAGLVPDAGWVNVVALTEASRAKWQGMDRWGTTHMENGGWVPGWIRRRRGLPRDGCRGRFGGLRIGIEKKPRRGAARQAFRLLGGSHRQQRYLGVAVGRRHVSRGLDLPLGHSRARLLG